MHVVILNIFSIHYLLLYNNIGIYLNYLNRYYLFLLRNAKKRIKIINAAMIT